MKKAFLYIAFLFISAISMAQGETDIDTSSWPIPIDRAMSKYAQERIALNNRNIFRRVATIEAWDSTWIRIDVDTLLVADITYTNTYYDDMLGPLVAANMDVTSGRIDYNYFNGAIGFNSNARYPNEPAGIRMQIPHKFKLDTYVHPHMHWKQQSATKPNWLFAYKIIENGEVDIIETDYSNYTLGVIDIDVFTYTSGVLNQISVFDSIDFSGLGISDAIHVILFRDSNNTSGLFSGADPSVIMEFATDLDIHIEIDTPGSPGEYTK